MVAETNYIYLALLLAVHYLGLNQTSYDVTLKNSAATSQQTPSISVDFKKVIDKQNEWIITTNQPGDNQRVPMTIVKNKVTDFEKGGEHTFTFEQINFSKINQSTDTVFDKNNVAVATILNNKTKKVLRFKLLKSDSFDTIEMKYN